MSDEEAVVTDTELRAHNEYLATKIQQLEGRVRQLEEALLAGADSATQKLAEKLRMLSVALATTEARERRALAQELHDDLGQLLAVIGLKMAAIEKLKLPKSIKGALNECGAAIAQGNCTLRTMAFDLNPPMLDDPMGFGAAMACLACEVHRVYKLEITTEDDGSPTPMDPTLGITLYRAVREVLVNVAKLAGVKKAMLVHGCRGGNIMVVVTVVGDGLNLAPQVSANASSGCGFISMRERLGLLGGAMSIQSNPGHGTTVTLAVPMLMAFAGRGMQEWA